MDPNWGLNLEFPDATQAIGYLGFPLFLQRVSQELTIAGLLKYPYTLVAMAVDQDKELDRRKGLGFGSQFLAQLGEAFAGAIRNQPTEIRSEVDVVARYEDQFLFSFPNTDFNEAMVPMRRVIEIARREGMRAAADNGFQIEVSCGLLTWEPVSGPIEPADFVYRTIEALYEARKDSPTKLFLFRMGLKDEDPERLRIKHNQTAPLRLKTRPVTGLIAAPSGRDGPGDTAGTGPEGRKRKKGKKRKVGGERGKDAGKEAGRKKKASKPFWKFW